MFAPETRLGGYLGKYMAKASMRPGHVCPGNVALDSGVKAMVIELQ